MASALGLLASAHAASITFDALGGTAPPNGSRAFASPLQIDGFTFVADDPGPANFGTWTAQSDASAASSNYTGSNALFATDFYSIRMRKSDLSAFDVFTLDVAQLYRDDLRPTEIDFQAQPAAGGTFAQTCTLPLDRSLHMVSLVGLTNLTSLTISGRVGTQPVSSYIQIDNINIQAVPEPSALAALTLAGLGLLRRRKRA